MKGAAKMLENLEPRGVWKWFEQLCAIPHGSGNTAAVADWCVKFAEERGLQHWRDQSDNVVIVKPAAPGYENAAPVILQGHLDMVCEKTVECAKDMSREGLELQTDGKWIWAEGTTLGADDGIAVAMALALLEDPQLPSPRLEVVLTSDEEIGMLGAAAIQVDMLQSRQMLNLDSEEEGIFTVSCAGGNRTLCTLPVDREARQASWMKVRVSGLRGGHSGECIDMGRANACMLLGRVLLTMRQRAEVRLVSVSGGQKDNAIPPAATAVIAVQDVEGMLRTAAEMEESFRREYRVADPEIRVVAERIQPEGLPMTEESSRRVVGMLSCLPNGVQEMSREIPGLPQTSLNLGILETAERQVTATFCVRSSVASQKEMLKARLRCLMELLGGTAAYSGDYPAWEYREESPLRERMVEVYREQTGKEPTISAIHAGVECGLFAGKLPGLDCVSIGPNLREIHTPREEMEIASVQRVWAFVREVLRRSR